VTYPTWRRVDAKHYETEEAYDGLPDVVLVRDGGLWYISFRTSAKTTGPFNTVAEAKQYVEASLHE